MIVICIHKLCPSQAQKEFFSNPARFFSHVFELVLQLHEIKCVPFDHTFFENIPSSSYVMRVPTCNSEYLSMCSFTYCQITIVHARVHSTPFQWSQSQKLVAWNSSKPTKIQVRFIIYTLEGFKLVIIS